MKFEFDRVKLKMPKAYTEDRTWRAVYVYMYIVLALILFEYRRTGFNCVV